MNMPNDLQRAARDVTRRSFLERGAYGLGGLALANSVAALTEASILLVVLFRRMAWGPPSELLGFAWRIGVAALHTRSGSSSR